MSDIPEWGSLIIRVPEKLNYLNKEVATLSRVHNQPRKRRGVPGIQLVPIEDWRATDAITQKPPTDLPPTLKRAKEALDKPKRPVGRPPLTAAERAPRKQKEKKGIKGRPRELPEEYYYLTPAMRVLYNEYRGERFDDIPTTVEKRKGEKTRKYTTKMFGSRWDDDLTTNPRLKVKSINVYMTLLKDYPKLKERFSKVKSGQYYTIEPEAEMFRGKPKSQQNNELWDSMMWVSNYENMLKTRRGEDRWNTATANQKTLQKVIPTFNYEEFRDQFFPRDDDSPVVDEDEDIPLEFDEKLKVWVDKETNLYYATEDINEAPPIGLIENGKLVPFKNVKLRPQTTVPKASKAPESEEEEDTMVFRQADNVWIDTDNNLAYRTNDKTQKPIGQIQRGKLVRYA